MGRLVFLLTGCNIISAPSRDRRTTEGAVAPGNRSTSRGRNSNRSSQSLVWLVIAQSNCSLFHNPLKIRNSRRHPKEPSTHIGKISILVRNHKAIVTFQKRPFTKDIQFYINIGRAPEDALQSIQLSTTSAYPLIQTQSSRIVRKDNRRRGTHISFEALLIKISSDITSLNWEFLRVTNKMLQPSYMQLRPAKAIEKATFRTFPRSNKYSTVWALNCCPLSISNFKDVLAASDY